MSSTFRQITLQKIVIVLSFFRHYSIPFNAVVLVRFTAILAVAVLKLRIPSLSKYGNNAKYTRLKLFALATIIIDSQKENHDYSVC